MTLRVYIDPKDFISNQSGRYEKFRKLIITFIFCFLSRSTGDVTEQETEPSN